MLVKKFSILRENCSANIIYNISEKRPRIINMTIEGAPYRRFFSENSMVGNLKGKVTVGIGA